MALDEAVGGYAPGMYGGNQCHDCGAVLNMVAKGSTQCQPCAMAEAKSDWRNHLTPAEATRLAELDAQAKAASKERRKIFDRARKRIPSGTKPDRETARENRPANPQES